MVVEAEEEDRWGQVSPGSSAFTDQAPPQFEQATTATRQGLLSSGRDQEEKAEVPQVLRVEEFVPKSEVSAMLDLTTALLDMAPVGDMAKESAVNLKRSMVWMEKYVAPTTEFWDWSTARHQIDNNAWLVLSYIGLGWVVALEAKVTSASHLPTIEDELTAKLSEITSHIPANAVLRLRSKEWTDSDVEQLRRSLTVQGYRVTRSGTRLQFEAPFCSIDLGDRERASFHSLTRPADHDVRQLLKAIKQHVNDSHQLQGADWCAYERRRLTVVSHFNGTRPSKNYEFCADPLGTFETDIVEDDLAFAIDGNVDRARLAFPLMNYHLGGVQPRCLLWTDTRIESHRVHIENYISYLWASHYTRLWHYLRFEDLFSYIDDLRKSRAYREDDLPTHLGHLLELADLQADIEILNRIDQSKISAYQPRHHDVSVASTRVARRQLGSADDRPITEWLRQNLIPSTVTFLRSDPLLQAPELLEQARANMIAIHNTAAQSAAVGMQRAVQILQIVFVIAAAAQIASLVPVGAVLDALIWNGPVSDSGLGAWLRARRASLNLPTAVDLSLGAFNAAAVVVLSVALLLGIRSRWGNYLSRRLIGG